MKCLKEVNNGKEGFSAKFTNNEQTTSYECACFFMMMQDKTADVDEIEGYIKIGEIVDPMKPWKEIKRIANSFAKEALKQAGVK